MKSVWAGLPGTITVLTQKFKVGTVKGLKVPDDAVTDEARGQNEEWVHEGTITVLGVCDRDENVMFMETNVGYDKAREVTLHEVVHAAVGAARLHKDIIHDHEESVVDRLTPVLLAIIRDNPKLIEFLTDRRQGGAGSATYWRNQK